MNLLVNWIDLYTYVLSQCGDDTISPFGALDKLKSKADGFTWYSYTATCPRPKEDCYLTCFSAMHELIPIRQGLWLVFFCIPIYFQHRHVQRLIDWSQRLMASPDVINSHVPVTKGSLLFDLLWRYVWMNLSPASNSHIWRKLVKCSAAQRSYNQSRLWDSWWQRISVKSLQLIDGQHLTPELDISHQHIFMEFRKNW